MRMVAESRLAELLGGKDASGKGSMAELLFGIFGSIPGASPRDLSALIESYRAVFTGKRDELTKQMQHLGAGVDKLRDASKTVDSLSRDAEEQRRLLVAKQKEADEALAQITVAMKRAADRKQEVEKLSVKLARDEVRVSSSERMSPCRRLLGPV